LSEAQSDAKILSQFHHFYMDSRRASIRQTIAAGQENGDFSPALNTDIAVDIALGPIILRLLSRIDGLDDEFAGQYPSMAVRALRA
ncbi:MAG TPA: TetR-like C-terminal domain-containing protein, partial [Micavibrio sp.]